MERPIPVLLVGRDPDGALAVADALTRARFEVVTAERHGWAQELIAEHRVQAVVADYPTATDARRWLADVLALDPFLPVLIVAAPEMTDEAVELVALGAHDYFSTPLQPREAEVFVRRALQRRAVREEHRELRQTQLAGEEVARLIGRSRPMRELVETLRRVAASRLPVLVRGESGTGKERVARALHDMSPRRDAAFVAVNTTALPEHLLESELFGHVQGAFTGADKARKGLFVEADGGTLFLDEIGDMNPVLQSRLLRVLEDGEVRAVGADTTRRVDIRIVAATHQPLERRVEERAFRGDLFYRLNVVPVHIPPLRERVEDVPLLVGHFLEAARDEIPEAAPRRVSPAAIAALARHPWPGNVRELENVIKRLVVMTPRDTIEPADVDAVLRAAGPSQARAASALPGELERAFEELPSLKVVQERYIAWVLARCDQNKTQAARILGINVSTLHRRGSGKG